MKKNDFSRCDGARGKSIDRRDFLAGAVGLTAVQTLPKSFDFLDLNLSPQRLHTVFHVDLTDAHHADRHYVVAGEHRLPLYAHTRETYEAALEVAPHLKNGGPHIRHTHYTLLPQPLLVRSVLRVHVKHIGQAFMGEEHGVSHAAMIYPGLGGIAQSALSSDPNDLPPACHAGLDYYSTAQCFLYHHPEVTSLDPPLVRKIHNYMDNDEVTQDAINSLAIFMRKMGPPARESGWARMVPMVIDNPDVNPVYQNRSLLHPTQDFQDMARTALSRLLLLIKNDRLFEKSKWNLQQGRSSVTVAQTKAGVEPQRLRPRFVEAALRLTHTSVAPAAADNWRASVTNTDPVHGLQTQVSVHDSGTRKIGVTLLNSYVRYLGVFIRFYDAHGQPIPHSEWKNECTEIGSRPEAQQTDDTRYIDFLPAIQTILGIPIYSQQGRLDVAFTFPRRAVSAKVYGGGLGTGNREVPEATVVGGTLTAMLNFAIPAFMLGFQVAVQDSKELSDLLSSTTVMVLAGLIGGSYLADKNSQGLDWRSLTDVGKFLFEKGAGFLLKYCEKQIVPVKIAEEVPFAGWIIIAINVVATAAQMAETVAEVACSPWLIENTIATTITTRVIVNHDPRNQALPQGSPRSYRVKMIYKDQARPTVTSATVAVPDDFKQNGVEVQFPNNTLGGDIRLEAQFYIGDWIAGLATTGWIPNDEVHAATVNLHLVQRAIPLNADSVYTHRQILVYDHGQYSFIPTRQAPTATRFNRNTRDDAEAHALGDWTGLALSQRYGVLGLSWQGAGIGIPACETTTSGQTYAFGAINIPGTPAQPLRISGCGMQGKTRVIFDTFPPRYKMDAGNWVVDGMQNLVPDPTDKILGDYYIDPSKADVPFPQGQGYHLRRISLVDGKGFDMRERALSYGRFAYFPDSVTIHPAGYVVAVNSQYHKLQVVRLETTPKPDAQVELGRIGSGKAENPTREGLMFRPLAVACSFDGTVLVLEENRTEDAQSSGVVSRISAYDLYMNPVARFRDAGNQPAYWLYLDRSKSFTLLDMTAVGDEKATYIYVLCFENDGRAVEDYKLAVYKVATGPTNSKPLFSSTGVAAAKLAVDMWHTAYTLNYAAVTDASGKPAGRTMPSISEWLVDQPNGSKG